MKLTVESAQQVSQYSHAFCDVHLGQPLTHRRQLSPSSGRQQSEEEKLRRSQNDKEQRISRKRKEGKSEEGWKVNEEDIE